MEDLVSALRRKTRSSESVSVVEGVKRELQTFAKSVGVFGSPLFSVAVLIVTNAVRRRCSLADILAANEDTISLTDAVEFLLEFRRFTKHSESILLLDCLLASLSFWRRLETRVQKVCYLLNFSDSNYAYTLVAVFVIDTLKQSADLTFTPRAELAKDVAAAASAVLSLLVQSSGVSSTSGREYSRLDELNMRLAFLEWLSRTYHLTESALIGLSAKLPIQALLSKIESYSEKFHLVRRGTCASMTLLPWSPLEVANIPELLLNEIDQIALWPSQVDFKLKRNLTDAFSPIKGRGHAGLADPEDVAEPLNEAEVDRERQLSRVFLKRTTTVVPDSPFKRTLQRFASAPLPIFEETPPRPAKRARPDRPSLAKQPVLTLQSAAQFSLDACVFRGFSGVWRVASLLMELHRLGLVPHATPGATATATAGAGAATAGAAGASDLKNLDELVVECIRELSEGGGPLHTLLTDGRRREQFENLAKLILALSVSEAWPLNLCDSVVVRGVCVLAGELLHAENFLAVEPAFAGVPQHPTVLSASLYSGFVFGPLSIWLGLDWLHVYAVLETLVDPAVKTLAAACAQGRAGPHLDLVKEELLRVFVFREESGLWAAIASLRRKSLRDHLSLKLGLATLVTTTHGGVTTTTHGGTTTTTGGGSNDEIIENTIHVTFLFGCVKLLDVTSRCGLGAKTASILNLTVDLLRTTLLYKTHLFRNRDVYEVLGCCLITAARLLRHKLGFAELREAFAVAGQSRKLSLTFSSLAAESDSLHSTVLGWDTALERGSEGSLEGSLLDQGYPKMDIEQFHAEVFLPEMEAFLAVALRVVDNKADPVRVEGREFFSPDASPYSAALFGEILRYFLRKLDRTKDEYSVQDWRKALRLSSPLGHLDCLFPVLAGPGRSQGGFAWINGILVKEHGDGIQIIST